MVALSGLALTLCNLEINTLPAGKTFQLTSSLRPYFAGNDLVYHVKSIKGFSCGK